MYRVTKLGGKYFAVKLSEVDLKDENDELDNMQTLVEEGTPVILVEELEELTELGIDDDVEVVEV